ncbi:unnamed protein product, partial [Ixodes persulcatus]
MFPTVRAARGDRAAKSLARRLLEPHRRHGCPRAGRRFFSLCRPDASMRVRQDGRATSEPWICSITVI